jgi:hypothetical protein
MLAEGRRRADNRIVAEPSPPAIEEHGTATVWSVIPLVVTGISTAGFLAGLVLYPLDYDEGGAWDDVFFVMLALGWIAALVTGLVAWFIGRRSGDGLLRRNGVLGVKWFGLVLNVESIHQAVG